MGGWRMVGPRVGHPGGFLRIKGAPPATILAGAPGIAIGFDSRHKISSVKLPEGDTTTASWVAFVLIESHPPKLPKTHSPGDTGKRDRSTRIPSYDPVCGKWGQVRTKRQIGRRARRTWRSYVRAGVSTESSKASGSLLTWPTSLDMSPGFVPRFPVITSRQRKALPRQVVRSGRYTRWFSRSKRSRAHFGIDQLQDSHLKRLYSHLGL